MDLKLICAIMLLAAAPQAGRAAEPQFNGRLVRIATCLKTGERVSGMNKICYYDCVGSEASTTVSSIALCPLSLNSNTNMRGAAVLPEPRRSTGLLCFKTGERQSGLNKTCTYDCGGSEKEISISSVSLCPLNTR